MNFPFPLCCTSNKTYNESITVPSNTIWYIYIYIYIHGESLARGPKLLSIKKLCYWDNDLMIYINIPVTIQNRTCSYSMPKLVSFHIHAHLNAFLQILEYFPKVSTLTAWISWRIASLSCSIVRVVFLCTLSFSRPQRMKSAGVRSASPCL